MITTILSPLALASAIAIDSVTPTIYPPAHIENSVISKVFSCHPELQPKINWYAWRIFKILSSTWLSGILENTKTPKFHYTIDGKVLMGTSSLAETWFLKMSTSEQLSIVEKVSCENFFLIPLEINLTLKKLDNIKQAEPFWIIMDPAKEGEEIINNFQYSPLKKHQFLVDEVKKYLKPEEEPIK